MKNSIVFLLSIIIFSCSNKSSTPEEVAKKFTEALENEHNLEKAATMITPKLAAGDFKNIKEASETNPGAIENINHSFYYKLLEETTDKAKVFASTVSKMATVTIVYHMVKQNKQWLIDSLEADY
jgi:PBP1b-binding outer membrane lipoprotein LpoB